MPDRRLSDSAEAATQDYLRRSSLTYLECAMNLMLTHMSKHEVAEVLRVQARIVEDFD